MQNWRLQTKIVIIEITIFYFVKERTFTLKAKIGFYGAGSMAEAIIAGMIANEIVPAEQILAINHTNKDRLLELENTYGIRIFNAKSALVKESDVIILAMKPKDIKTATAEMKEYLTDEKIVVSLLAGISTSFIEQQLGTKNSIIRVMPNTSATIGESASTIALGQYATQQQADFIEQLIQAIGTTAVIKEEEMDAYTALAGSGPAFYYYMVEAMEQFVLEKGLDEKIAKPLMIQTIKGVTEMLASSSDTPKMLREKITSPGGTTEAGLQTLAEYDFQKAVIACLKQAANRSEELRAQFEK